MILHSRSCLRQATVVTMLSMDGCFSSSRFTRCVVKGGLSSVLVEINYHVIKDGLSDRRPPPFVDRVL